ncbi:MAG: hypothetical protein JKY54_13205 [Flavobacteriales bacterium]|nr:hypothetical protein [Flavobacteriales bacterium]
MNDKLVLNLGDSYWIQGELVANDLYLTPESGSLKVELKDIFGNEILSLVDQAYPFELTADQFVIPDGQTSKDFRLKISFTVEGLVYTLNSRIKVEKVLPVSFDKSDVINELNARDHIDESIVDIHLAYHQVNNEIETELFSDTSMYIWDNRLVYLRTLINLLPTYELKVLQTKRVDDHSETRFKANLKDIKLSFESEYYKILADNYGYSAEIDTLVSVVETTDIITGES